MTSRAEQLAAATGPRKRLFVNVAALKRGDPPLIVSTDAGDFLASHVDCDGPMSFRWEPDGPAPHAFIETRGALTWR